jgi:hypothetical protein
MEGCGVGEDPDDVGAALDLAIQSLGSAPGLVDTRGGWFLGRFCGRVDHLKLGWCDFGVVGAEGGEDFAGEVAFLAADDFGHGQAFGVRRAA